MNVNGIEIHASLDESVINGTMRPQDLIPAFLNVIISTPEYAQIMFQVNMPWDLAVITDSTPYNDDDERWESEAIIHFLNETLFEVLNNYAPDGYYFGSHPGNGSDYGYWKQEEDADFPTMTALDWGKTTEERNGNLEKYHSLLTEEEKSNFLKNLKK